MLIAPTKPAHECVRHAAAILRPARREAPHVLASEYLRTEKGPWDKDLTPYMIEPLDELSGRRYQGIVFVGPARTGKTMSLILGGITYIVKGAPGDTLVVQMSQDAARDFSKLDLDRAIRHSPALLEELSPRARDDNVFDKFWRSGIALKLGWPAISQLSSKTLQYVFLTDYDRPQNVHNVDGEGPLWDLAWKRTQTYMSRGKCVAESSPGEEISNAKWRPSTPNEAPPARGILSLYNRGTRARWHWPCKHKGCEQYFEARPGLDNFAAMPELKELESIVKSADLDSLAYEWAKVFCPHCGGAHEPQDRRAMNLRGLWLHEGEEIVNGVVIGDRRNSAIASYWLGGVSAAYQTWPSIVTRYLEAVQTYALTSDEEPLRTTTNTDQGAPYLPLASKRKRSGEDLKLRLEDWPRGTAPAGTRFITAAVDVQARRFVVSFMAWGVDLESWLIERFEITASDRPEGERFAALDPSAFWKDWQILVDKVIEKQFELPNGAKLKPRVTLCDSGGKAGVTDKAYKFWRWCRGKGIGKRFLLVKGDGNKNRPRVQLIYPDARNRKDRRAGQGDVPVYILNTNAIKDGIAGDLSRDEPGANYCHLPAWIDEDYFDEVTAEVRTGKGWENQSHQANEAFDLHCYNRAGVIILRAEGINWDRPPAWAKEPEPPTDDNDNDDNAGPASKKRTPPKPRRNWTSKW